MTQRFEGKVALVTGGASGIGAATVRRLAQDGARILAADLNAPEAPLAAGVVAHVCDVASPEAAAGMVAATIERFGRLDILVNNAGVGILAETPDVTDEQWRHVFAVNVDAIFYACRASLPHLRENGGAIVNVASISGLFGDYGLTAYNASKGAVINYTRALALDHAHEGIRVNAICPGFIAGTGLTGAITDLAAWTAHIPLGRPGTPDDMAKVIAFLASDEASYMTGAIVVADGGMTAHTGQPNVPAARRRALAAGGA
jgi:meso-butanediol dehydrogenase / (S,S)-butanediol dehydrogenase / diacetyl reductase